MTRKDYQRIARALILAKQDALRKQAYGSHNAPVDGVNIAAESLCHELGADNPNFNRQHFLAVVEGERELDSRPPRSA